MEELGLMFRSDRSCGLDFADNRIINQKVGVVDAYRLTLVAHRDLSLRSRADASTAQLLSEGRLVHLLEESRPQFPVHPEPSADDLLGKLPVRICAVGTWGGASYLCTICVHLWQNFRGGGPICPYLCPSVAILPASGRPLSR